MLDEVVEQNSDLLSVFCDRERERKKEKQKIHRRFIELINLATINTFFSSTFRNNISNKVSRVREKRENISSAQMILILKCEIDEELQ